MRNYKRYYVVHTECEWCGQHTRGRIYPTNPTSVICGSCNKEIVRLPSDEDLRIGDDVYK